MLRGEPLGRHVKRIQYYPTEFFIVWGTFFKRIPIDIERLKLRRGIPKFTQCKNGSHLERVWVLHGKPLEQLLQ